MHASSHVSFKRHTDNGKHINLRARVTNGWRSADQQAAIVQSLALREGRLQINRLSLYVRPAL